MEMWLRSRTAQQVTLAELDLSFDPGEEMRTEISAKFRPDGLRAELAADGLVRVDTWTDPDNDFTLTLARAEG